MKRKKNSLKVNIALAGITLTFLLAKTGLPALSDLNSLWKQCSTKVTLNMPDSFGKKHFILGYPHESNAQEKTGQNTTGQAGAGTTHNGGVQQSQANGSAATSNVGGGNHGRPIPSAPEQKNSVTFTPGADGHIRQVLFSPDDEVHAALLQLITQEQSSIQVAVFSFTDGDVAHALVSAHQRGVDVQVITDTSCVQGKYNKIEFLHDKGVPVYVYNLRPARGNTSGIMHHKFAVFGNTLGGKNLVWTGSFNFTRSAHKNNQENVMVFDDSVGVQRYQKQFTVLKQRSERYIVA